MNRKLWTKTNVNIVAVSIYALFRNFIRMFCQRSSNIRINYLHERALRIVYKDNEINI